MKSMDNHCRAFAGQDHQTLIKQGQGHQKLIISLPHPYDVFVLVGQIPATG